MTRKNLVAANWKMNKTVADAETFVTELKSGLGGVGDCDLLIFPPFFSLPRVCSMLEGTGVAAGAQDVFWEESGAYTGEVSSEMIRDAGGSYVLIGHSERRHVIGENNDIVYKKLRAALKGDLTPILCVGEQIEHRESDEHESYVEEQLRTGLSGLSEAEFSRIVIAYEPVWAIGTGKTATPEDALNMHRFIRGYVRNSLGDAAADNLRIQYGGSVKPSNAADLLSEEEIDGALIGGASLEAESFLAIAAAIR
jgi:triosephosphate isomerase